LKLKRDEPLPNFSLHFNLRRCTKVLGPLHVSGSNIGADEPGVQ
jgi:hypothetical protein